MKALNITKRIIIYLVGCAIIALGINVSKLSGLGISPVSSIPGVLSAAYPSLSLGNMIMIVYCVLVLAQFIVLRKDFKPVNILGVPVAIIFGLITDFVGIANFKIKLMGIDLGIEKEFSGLLINFPRPEAYWLRLIYLLASILIIGVGVFIYLKPRLVPMPAEGLAAAIAQKTGKKFGDCKTGVDVSLILIATILQIILLGGFSSFTGGSAVVREGTILAAILVGQVVKLIGKCFKKKG